jgi:hypothetical protein
MKGGKLSCNKIGFNKNNCTILNCVDYENQIYDSFKQIICDDWEMFYDENAQAKYWYNWKTREATWIDPNTDDVVLERGGKRKTKNKRKCKRKSKRIFLHKNKKQI